MARIACAWTCKRNDALRPDPACIEEAPDPDHILITDVPDHPIRTNWMDVMDMGSRQARRVPACDTDRGCAIRYRQGCVSRVTDINRALGQVTQRCRPETEPCFVPSDGGSRIACQRRRIHRRHEDRTGQNLRIGEPAKGAGAERLPAAARRQK